MAWTEPELELRRSRDELLATAVRRGRRIRRRRRTATTLVGALLLVLPVTVLASLGTSHTVGVDLTAAGPLTTTGLDAVPSAAAPAVPAASPSASAGDDDATGTPTTTAPSGRSAAPSTVAQPDAPRTLETTVRTSVPSAVDDPGPRPSPAPPSTSATIAGGGGMAAGSAASPAVAASTTVPVPADDALADCPAADVAVTVATERAAYAGGEMVAGFSTLENRSPAACLLPTRSFFRIDDATGHTVSSFRYTTDYRLPVRAEPGRTVTDAFTWDQRDCSTGPCLQVPAGTYVVSADWTEGGSYGGRSSFRIGS